MRKVKVLPLDLKTYYASPPYQLGLLVEYARLEPEVRRCVEFVFHAEPRQRTPEDIARTILDADADLVALSDYAWTHKRVGAILAILGRAQRILLLPIHPDLTDGEQERIVDAVREFGRARGL